MRLLIFKKLFDWFLWMVLIPVLLPFCVYGFFFHLHYGMDRHVNEKRIEQPYAQFVPDKKGDEVHFWSYYWSKMVDTGGYTFYGMILIFGFLRDYKSNQFVFERWMWVCFVFLCALTFQIFLCNLDFFPDQDKLTLRIYTVTVLVFCVLLSTIIQLGIIKKKIRS